jgi:hypothetical protein
VSVEVSGAGEITPTPAAEPTSAGPEPSEQATELARTFGRASEKLDRLTATDRPSGDLVLVRNERFEIVWMIYNRQLVIKVFQPPYEEGRQAVTQWFLDKGFTQEELCALGEFGRIGIYPTQDAVPGDQFPGDTGPTGCPAPTAIPPQ